MTELLKLVKSLKERGAASASEKKEVREKFSDLEEEEQEVVEDDVEEVEDLPEEDADEDDGEKSLEKSIESLMKAQAKDIKSEVASDVYEKVEKSLEKHRELSEKKAGAYHPEAQTESRQQKSECLRKTAKALIDGDEAKMKELTSDDSGSPYGGYTIDDELSAEIRHLTTEYGVARREMQNVQLTKGNYKANNLATDVTVYWVDEGAVVNSTQAVLGQEELTLKKLGAIVTLTSELLEETEIDFVSFLASRVAEGFAQATDEAFFNGDGTASFGGFTGLLQAGDVNEVVMATGNTSFEDLDADDLIDMRDATPQGALDGGKFYMHRTIMSIIRKLKDSQGRYIYQAPSDGGPETAWGDPIVKVEAMPDINDDAVSTSFILYGDLNRACIFGYRGGIRAARFNAGNVRDVADAGDINLITTDRTAVRWIDRLGYVRIIPDAVTKLTTAAS